MEDVAWFAEILLPLSLPQTYTYLLPGDMVHQAAIGKRAEVQFGKQKIYAGIITQVHQNAPTTHTAKPVLSILDDVPVIHQLQLDFWQWMASYYMCTMGDVMNAALPAGFKLDSKSHIVLNPDANVDFNTLTDKEYLVTEALTLKHELTLDEVQKILGIRTIRPVINSLLKQNIIEVNETATEKYKPRLETFVYLNDAYLPEKEIEKLLNTLNTAPKRQSMLMAYLQLKQQLPHVMKKELLAKSGGSDSVLKAMAEAGIWRIEKRDVFRLMEETTHHALPPLTHLQQEANDQIHTALKKHTTVLLHGVTSSGKTTVYMHHIQDVIQKGGQVLYLMPEIALTHQMINRLRQSFGENVGVYHSRFNTHERVEIWNKLLSGQYKIIIGARSALLMPFANLQLIIVDEEHDSSYKQQEPAPRYQARDSALYLASMYPGCYTLLGTATPSVETYFNAQAGKYGYVTLSARYGDVLPPKTEVIDMLEAGKRKIVKGSFTPVVIDKIASALREKEQVILFQNRRGYAPYLQCGHCGWIPECPNCDVTLTYYKYTHELRCHYCNYRSKTYTECVVCKQKNLALKGTGTEKLEDELQQLFPQARVARMDYDTTRTKYSQNKLISDVEQQQIDILVGTQMVTKGLDFAHVNTIVIPEADRLFAYPDFRSHERAFQLLMQVSGRAGRRHTQGHVLIQAFNIDHPVIQYLLQNNYTGFFEYEIAIRKEFSYPPFVRLINIELKHPDKNVLTLATNYLYEALHKTWEHRVLQPTEPVVNKVQNKYRMHILLKLEKDPHVLARCKQHILKCIDTMQFHPAMRQTDILTDVDPY